MLFPLLKYEPSPFCPLLDFWCPDSIFTERPLREPVWVPEWKVEPMRILFQSPLQHFLVLFTQERIRPFWAAPDLFAALHPGEAQPAPTRQLSGKLTKQSLLKAQMNCVLGIFFSSSHTSCSKSCSIPRNKRPEESVTKSKSVT